MADTKTSPIPKPGAPTELQIHVARKIVDFICQRKLKTGEHLTEQGLVDELQVSRSPIRGALIYLSQKGVVEQRANRGFFVLKNGAGMAPDELDLAQTSDEQICLHVARDWFEGRVPRAFKETEFRERYKLGRLATSRILLKLSEDGVVVRNPGHGWRFERTLNTQQAHDDSYGFRAVIEPAAILSPAFELDQGLAEICRHRHSNVLQRRPGEAALTTLFEIDAEFHRLIGVSSRNRFFCSAIEKQNALRRLVEYASLLDKDRLIASCAEHMEILSLLETGDRQKASRLMTVHLKTASRYSPEYGGDD